MQEFKKFTSSVQVNLCGYNRFSFIGQFDLDFGEKSHEVAKNNTEYLDDNGIVVWYRTYVRGCPVVLVFYKLKSDTVKDCR